MVDKAQLQETIKVNAGIFKKIANLKIIDIHVSNIAKSFLNYFV